MRIDVLFFAVVRERLRLDHDAFEVPSGATVAAALDLAAKRHPALVPLLPRLRFAVGRTLVDDDHILHDGDELAMIPPVAGGSDPARVAVSANPLSLDAVVSGVSGPDAGAVVTFSGVVRRQGQQPNVARLDYEAYEPMALDVLRAIADEAERAALGVRVAVHHRVGTLAVGELAVVIAAAAPHRAEAFTACRTVIEELKKRAPIWKKETGDDGATWIGFGP